ncbi:MAG: hypothetical protein ACFFDN_35050, partial [Candidatus Hodarchaeota archaeon]
YYIFHIKIDKFDSVDDKEANDRVLVMQEIQAAVLQHFYQANLATSTQQKLNEIAYTIFVTVLTSMFIGGSVIQEPLEEVFVDPLVESSVAGFVGQMGGNAYAQIAVSCFAESGREAFSGDIKTSQNSQSSSSNLETTANKYTGASTDTDTKANAKVNQIILSSLAIFAGVFMGVGIGAGITTAIGLGSASIFSQLGMYKLSAKAAYKEQVKEMKKDLKKVENGIAEIEESRKVDKFSAKSQQNYDTRQERLYKKLQQAAKNIQFMLATTQKISQSPKQGTVQLVLEDNAMDTSFMTSPQIKVAECVANIIQGKKEMSIDQIATEAGIDLAIAKQYITEIIFILYRTDPDVARSMFAKIMASDQYDANEDHIMPKSSDSTTLDLMLKKILDSGKVKPQSQTDGKTTNNPIESSRKLIESINLQNIKYMSGNPQRDPVEIERRRESNQNPQIEFGDQLDLEKEKEIKEMDDRNRELLDYSLNMYEKLLQIAKKRNSEQSIKRYTNKIALTQTIRDLNLPSKFKLSKKLQLQLSEELDSQNHENSNIEKIKSQRKLVRKMQKIISSRKNTLSLTLEGSDIEIIKNYIKKCRDDYLLIPARFRGENSPTIFLCDSFKDFPPISKNLLIEEQVIYDTGAYLSKEDLNLKKDTILIATNPFLLVNREDGIKGSTSSVIVHEMGHYVEDNYLSLSESKWNDWIQNYYTKDVIKKLKKNGDDVAAGSAYECFADIFEECITGGLRAERIEKNTERALENKKLDKLIESTIRKLIRNGEIDNILIKFLDKRCKTSFSKETELILQSKVERIEITLNELIDKFKKSNIPKDISISIITLGDINIQEIINEVSKRITGEKRTKTGQELINVIINAVERNGNSNDRYNLIGRGILDDNPRMLDFLKKYNLINYNIKSNKEEFRRNYMRDIWYL